MSDETNLVLVITRIRLTSDIRYSFSRKEWSLNCPLEYLTMCELLESSLKVCF